MTVVEGRALDGLAPAIGPTPSDQFVPRLTAASVDLEDTMMPPNDPRRPSIPHGWISARIRDVAPLQRGFDLPTSNIRPGRHPVAYSNGILQYHERAMVAGPGVVTGRSGTIGKVQFIESDYWPHNTALWVKSFYENDPKFIYYLYTHINLSQLASGSGVPTLNRNDVHQRWVSCPPVPEQRAIAEALSDVDDLLRSLESLIAKKQAIKTAAMQQLLTGKTRLPGFSAEWRTTRLEEHSPLPEGTAFVKGRGLSKADLSRDGTIPCIHYGELFSYGEHITDVLHKTDLEGDFVYSVRNDVLMPTSDVTPNGLATASCLQRAGVILGGGILVIRVPEDVLDGVFLAYSIRHHRDQVMQLVTGTTVYHLYARDMAKFRFPVPALEEQRAIAEALLDMDAEITAFERQLGKIHAIKEGMMQQLLTGRVRLATTE